MLGVLRSQQGRHDEALSLIDAALSYKQDDFGALSNKGLALQALDRCDEAITCFKQAIALKADFFQAHYNLARVLTKKHRYTDAIAAFDKAIALQPTNIGALHGRADTLAAMGRLMEAIASYDKVLFHAPHLARAWNDRGIMLWRLNHPQEALISYGRAIACEPGFAEAWSNIGGLLQQMHRHEEALAALNRAIALNPRLAPTWNNRGSVLRALHRPESALDCFDRALALDPYYAEAFANRATLHWVDRKDAASAIADLQQALTADPDWPYARGELLHLKMHLCDWKDFDETVAQIDAAVQSGKRAVRPFAYQSVATTSANLKSCAELFATHHYPLATPVTQRSRSGEKIRIGYVSGEFREHATAYLMAGLYERHDRDRFAITAFDTGRSDGSPTRRRLEAAFDKCVAIADLSDAGAAEAIAAEGIDILVNLNGYFGEQRMGIFAHRPAPIQVNYLGYPGTLGAPYIDYILADRYVIPEAERHCYTEQVIWLSDSYQANDDRRFIPQSAPERAALGLPKTGFVFCNFNQSYKLTPAVFARWMNILRKTDDSVLWLWRNNPYQPANLQRAASEHGVAPDRLIFAQHMPLEQHLARLSRADLFLDTLPCNAHTTASDALWVGLPLLTCRGSTFPGRVAASLLDAAGLPELVVETMDAYEREAIALSRDRPRLQSLRARLVRNRFACALFDTDGIRRKLEAAYTRMWDIHRNGGKPGDWCMVVTAA